MSNPPIERQRPQKQKSAAMLASEANRRQQMAINTHSPRPSDRRSPQQQGGQDDKS
jgi:hypothetical protein